MLIITGGYFGYTKIFSNDGMVRYATAQVQKGTLIISISGNGQIDVSDQIDLKPEVSGKIIAVYVTKGQEVKKGSLLAVTDPRDTERSVSDAEIALDDAKEKLDDLLSQPDAQSLRQAEVALAQAKRDLNKAKESYENIEIDTESLLVTAYEDGYNTVVAVFLKLSNYMKDLKDVLGTEPSAEKHISGYELILGQGSLFTQKLLSDYYRANNLFNKNYAFFITVFQDDDRDTVDELINDTLETTRAISQTLDSARHMFDAIILKDYQHLNISSHIDKMKPKIESDASSVSSNISSLQDIKDTIDDTIENTPEKIEDSEWALQSAQEKFDERKLALEELMAGVDSRDIRSQENIVAQKESALLDAKEKLAGHFIRAPFDGVIEEIDIKVGDSVSSSTTLATLMTKQYIANLALNEIDIAKVKLNQPVTLTFDIMDGLTLTGKVTDIASIASTNQGLVTYDIIVTLDTMNELVKPGMSVTAAIITDAKPNVLLVSNSAVKSQGGISYVEIPDDFDMSVAAANVSGAVFENPTRQQQVEIGLSNDEFTEILKGLQEGDVIVTRTIQPTSAQSTQIQQNSSSVQAPGFNTGGTGGIRMMR